MNLQKQLKRFVFGAMAVLLVVLASATFLEKVHGSEWVHQHIYGAWWFVALWGIFGITSFIYIIRQALYQNKPAFLLHCALGIILSGAFVTFLTAERGYMHIRQGEKGNEYFAEKDLMLQPLPFNVELVLFDIEYSTETNEPIDYISFLRVDGEMCKVSLNKIYSYQFYRFYQLSYDSDEMGTELLVNHDPWGIGITYTGYLLLTLSMLWILFIRIGWKGLIYTIIPVTALWFYISQLNPMTPILRTPMLAAHVSVIMASYGLLVFITITSIIALCSSRKRRKLYYLNSKLLYPALFLLAAGIFIGAVWANISWGRYWGWDAKETWALITLLVYCLPMHKQTFPFFANPTKFHRYCIIAFFSVLMTFLGVTYFLGGVHSYV